MSTNYVKPILKQIDNFHSHDKPFDDALNVWLHKAYAEVIEKGKDMDWSKVYFSPSSSDMCPRALWHKAKKHKKDPVKPLPHQRRWTHLGENIGDLFQMEFLLMARHYEKLVGEKPRFTMGMIDGKYPAFEEFTWKMHEVNHNGETFYLAGNGDGILHDNVEDKLIGLEVKSTQQTPSKTNYRNMTSAKEAHIKQVIVYSMMYDLDTYLILYYNGAKKAWFLSEDEYKDNPDLRIFQIDVTKDMQNDMLDFFSDIARRVRENDPPLPDLRKWLFNPYKNAIAKTITDDEMVVLERTMNGLFELGGYSKWEERSIKEALEDLKRRRAKL